MGDTTPSSEAATELSELRARVAELESHLGRLTAELRTGRLVVFDDRERERLVAEVVDGVLELRLELPPAPPGRRSALLAFTSPGREPFGSGLGLQLWADGELVDELCWWADGDRPPRRASGPQRS